MLHYSCSLWTPSATELQSKCLEVIAYYARTNVLCSYFDVIKAPMDMSTMNAKLESGQYKDRFAFEADFRLMTNNAKTYNMPGSFAHNETLELESFFDKSKCAFFRWCAQL